MPHLIALIAFWAVVLALIVAVAVGLDVLTERAFGGQLLDLFDERGYEGENES